MTYEGEWSERRRPGVASIGRPRWRAAPDRAALRPPPLPPPGSSVTHRSVCVILKQLFLRHWQVTHGARSAPVFACAYPCITRAKLVLFQIHKTMRNAQTVSGRLIPPPRSYLLPGRRRKSTRGLRLLILFSSRLSHVEVCRRERPRH